MKFISTILMLALISCSTQKNYVYIPEIEGEWWPVAHNPDLGAYTTKKQQPVDFGIWQAADGTWQLWSCIRQTACGGNTRLFFGWEGRKLTDNDWKPLGITMEADTLLGEVAGGLQAPHVIRKDDTYYMLYGDWNHICLAKSRDGKQFERVINETGTPQLFSGPMTNTRDPMTLKIGDTYYCYYVGHLNKDDPAKIKAAIFCRTSADLHTWSDPVMVSGGGSVAELDGWGGGDAECPFVVPIGDRYVLFRNQIYGANNLNTQYCSPDQLNFGVDDDRYLVGQLKVAAPEIIRIDNQYYIAALTPELDGIRIAKLRFKKEYKQGKR
ncbi:MAG: family 43 glycosylhydrolase [Prolixibacteraceae bacterium]